jgi:excisionase family DNA binding protein
MQIVQPIYNRFARFRERFLGNQGFKNKKGGAKMAEQRMNLMTAKEAARYLRVSMFTLSKIEREGGLIPYRTPGGHRRYSLRMLNRYLNSSRQRRKEV